MAKPHEEASGVRVRRRGPRTALNRTKANMVACLSKTHFFTMILDSKSQQNKIEFFYQTSIIFQGLTGMSFGLVVSGVTLSETRRPQGACPMPTTNASRQTKTSMRGLMTKVAEILSRGSRPKLDQIVFTEPMGATL